MEILYRDRDRANVDDLDYIGPDVFIPGTWHLIAVAPKSSADGVDVQIFEVLPARSYKLAVPPYINSVGDSVPGFSMRTGSGDCMCRLIVTMAKAIAAGMLNLDTENI